MGGKRLCSLDLGVLLVSLTLGAALLTAATHSATGIIRHNSKTMKLEAAVAVWKPAENELRVALLPFTPSAQEIEKIRNSGAVFVAADRTSLSGTQHDRPPFAELVMEFQPGASTPSLDRITHYRLEVAWLKRMNHTSTMNRNDQDEVHREFKNLRGSLRDGGKVQLALQGSGTVFDDELDWNFPGRCDSSREEVMWDLCCSTGCSASPQPFVSFSSIGRTDAFRGPIHRATS